GNAEALIKNQKTDRHDTTFSMIVKMLAENWNPLVVLNLFATEPLRLGKWIAKANSRSFRQVAQGYSKLTRGRIIGCLFGGSFNRFFDALAQASAHEVDVIAQTVEHARIGSRHSELVCLLLQAIEPPAQVARVASAPARARHLVLQKPQLSVQAQ